MVAGEIGSYLRVLWRYKLMIAAAAVIATLVALVVSRVVTPIYSATATLRVASAPGGAADYTSISSATRLSNTYVEIASSDISLDEVVKRLGLESRPKVEIEVVPETELIRISASDPDPARARDIANTLAGMMVEQSVQLYGGNAPTARQILERQVAQARADLDKAASAYDLALRQSAMSPAPDTQGTPESNAELGTLERLVSIRQQMYGDLLQQYENARISEQLRASAITIVQPASLAQRPTSPKKALNAALGLLTGLALGMILAFLFEGMDDTVRDIDQIQAVTTLPILSRVPNLDRASLGLSRDGRLIPAPVFEHLRARLILSDSRPPSSTFLITSPEPGAGKSTISANLAVSLAQGGAGVVLIDMDLYRPRQRSILGLRNPRGLSDYLRGEIPLDETLQATSLPNLRVITAGSGSRVPPELLTPVAISRLLESLSGECEYLLIDAPALLSVAEPLMIAHQVDGVVLIVANRKTRRQNLQAALDQLVELKANVLGIVFNRAPASQLHGYYRRSASGMGSPSNGRGMQIEPQVPPQRPTSHPAPQRRAEARVRADSTRVSRVSDA